MQKKLLITTMLTMSNFIVFAQQKISISNSFEGYYRKSNPALKYSYDSISQVHNYSDNWDFDQDCIKDQVYFVGTGGAHLYYFLKIILSSDNKPRLFDFIESDFPLLTATDTLNFAETPVGFVVADIGKNLTPAIIVRLDDNTYYADKEILAKKKVKTKNIIVRFENGKTLFGSL